jgi:hypothetical protein
MGTDLDRCCITLGCLALIVALSEIIKDAQRMPALEMIRDQGLSEEDLGMWRVALTNLDGALDKVKASSRACATLRQSRPDFDKLVNRILDHVLSPEPC